MNPAGVLAGVCRLAAASPVAALAISAVLLLALLGIAYAWRVLMERASW